MHNSTIDRDSEPSSLPTAPAASFTELWDKGDAVRRHSQFRIRLLEEFAAVLNDRAQVEIDYSKGLQRVGTTIKRIVSSKGDFGGILALYSSDALKRSSLSYQLGENIRQYVVEVLRDVVKEQEILERELSAESKRMEKLLITSQETLERTHQRYAKAAFELDELAVQNQILRLTSYTPPEKKDRHRLKLAQTERELSDFKHIYSESVESYNAFLEGFYNNQWAIMKTFEHQEEVRNESLLENLLKLLMFEMSFLKNAENQVKLLSQDLLNIDWHVSEIRKFVRETRSNKPKLQQVPIEIHHSFLSQKIKEIRHEAYQPKNESAEKQKNFLEVFMRYAISTGKVVEKDDTECEVDSSKSLYVADILLRAWNGEDISEQELAEFTLRSSESIECIEHFTFALQQFRIQNKFILLSKTAYDSVSSLLSIAFTACFRLRDCRFSRQLLGLSFTYFALEKTPNTEQYQEEVPSDIREDESEQEVSDARSFSELNLVSTMIDDEQSLRFRESSEIMPMNESILVAEQTAVSNVQHRVGDEGDSASIVKVYLSNAIQSHELWQSREFWECSIFSSSFEELRDSYSHRKQESLKDSLLRERNICLGQLASILQNMLHLEIDKKLVRLLLHKYAKLFALTQDQAKYLNTIVDLQ